MISEKNPINKTNPTTTMQIPVDFTYSIYLW